MPAALTAVISAECALIIAETFNIDYGSLTTMTCIIYAFSAYMMLFKVCKPLKSWRGVLFAAMGIGFAACIAAIPWFFNIVRLNAACVIITVLIIIPVYPLQRAIESGPRSTLRSPRGGMPKFCRPPFDDPHPFTACHRGAPPPSAASNDTLRFPSKPFGGRRYPSTDLP